MRSRYTAFVRGAVDHLVATHDPRTRGEVDRVAIEAWSRTSDWLGLTILGVERGGPSDDDGTVEFVARYRAQGQGQEQAHRERSRFRRDGGRWVYVDGRVAAGAPVRAAPRPERNAPCPCGSGRKYKRCHGGD